MPLVFISAAALILAVSVLQDSHNMAFRDELTGLPLRSAVCSRDSVGMSCDCGA